MLTTGKKLNRPRRYSRDFKRQLVSEYERGESTVLELSRRYQIAYQVIYRWIKEYSLYNQQEYLIVEKSKSKSAALKSANSRIRELERALGQKQLELDYLHKLLDLAKTMFGTLISLENTDFRNLIFAIFTRNSSLFLRKMTCQNPKFSIFANKFSVPNMV